MYITRCICTSRIPPAHKHSRQVPCSTSPITAAQRMARRGVSTCRIFFSHGFTIEKAPVGPWGREL